MASFDDFNNNISTPVESISASNVKTDNEPDFSSPFDNIVNKPVSLLHEKETPAYAPTPLPQTPTALEAYGTDTLDTSGGLTENIQTDTLRPFAPGTLTPDNIAAINKANTEFGQKKLAQEPSIVENLGSNYLLKPLQENIIKPVQENIIKPVQENIIKPVDAALGFMMSPIFATYYGVRGRSQSEFPGADKSQYQLTPQEVKGIWQSWRSRVPDIALTDDRVQNSIAIAQRSKDFKEFGIAAASPELSRLAYSAPALLQEFFTTGPHGTALKMAENQAIKLGWMDELNRLDLTKTLYGSKLYAPGTYEELKKAAEGSTVSYTELPFFKPGGENLGSDLVFFGMGTLLDFVADPISAIASLKFLGRTGKLAIGEAKVIAGIEKATTPISALRTESKNVLEITREIEEATKLKDSAIKVGKSDLQKTAEDAIIAAQKRLDVTKEVVSAAEFKLGEMEPATISEAVYKGYREMAAGEEAVRKLWPLFQHNTWWEQTQMYLKARMLPEFARRINAATEKQLVEMFSDVGNKLRNGLMDASTGMPKMDMDTSLYSGRPIPETPKELPDLVKQAQQPGFTTAGDITKLKDMMSPEELLNLREEVVSVFAKYGKAAGYRQAGLNRSAMNLIDELSGAEKSVATLGDLTTKELLAIMQSTVGTSGFEAASGAFIKTSALQDFIGLKSAGKVSKLAAIVEDIGHKDYALQQILGTFEPGKAVTSAEVEAASGLTLGDVINKGSKSNLKLLTDKTGKVYIKNKNKLIGDIGNDWYDIILKYMQVTDMKNLKTLFNPVTDTMLRLSGLDINSKTPLVEVLTRLNKLNTQYGLSLGEDAISAIRAAKLKLDIDLKGTPNVLDTTLRKWGVATSTFPEDMSLSLKDIGWSKDTMPVNLIKRLSSLSKDTGFVDDLLDMNIPDMLDTLSRLKYANGTNAAGDLIKSNAVFKNVKTLARNDAEFKEAITNLAQIGIGVDDLDNIPTYIKAMSAIAKTPESIKTLGILTEAQKVLDYGEFMRNNALLYRTIRNVNKLDVMPIGTTDEIAKGVSSVFNLADIAPGDIINIGGKRYEYYKTLHKGTEAYYVAKSMEDGSSINMTAKQLSNAANKATVELASPYRPLPGGALRFEEADEFVSRGEIERYLEGVNAERKLKDPAAKELTVDSDEALKWARKQKNKRDPFHDPEGVKRLEEFHDMLTNPVFFSAKNTIEAGKDITENTKLAAMFGWLETKTLGFAEQLPAIVAGMAPVRYVLDGTGIRRVLSEAYSNMLTAGITRSQGLRSIEERMIQHSRTTSPYTILKDIRDMPVEGIPATGKITSKKWVGGKIATVEETVKRDATVSEVVFRLMEAFPDSKTMRESKSLLWAALQKKDSKLADMLDAWMTEARSVLKSYIDDPALRDLLELNVEKTIIGPDGKEQIVKVPKTVENYLTHVFDTVDPITGKKIKLDKQRVKNLEQLLEQDIRTMHPGFGPSKTRTGAFGFSEDAFNAVDYYIAMAERKIHMGAVTKEALNILREGKHPAWVKMYTENLLRSINGVREGFIPNAIEAASRFATNLVYMGGVGDIGSALTNLTQLPLVAVPRIGIDWIMNGVKWAADPEIQKSIAKFHLIEDLGDGFKVADRYLTAFPKEWNWKGAKDHFAEWYAAFRDNKMETIKSFSMLHFAKAERFNRLVTYAAARQKMLYNLGQDIFFINRKTGEQTIKNMGEDFKNLHKEFTGIRGTIINEETKKVLSKMSVVEDPKELETLITDLLKSKKRSIEAQQFQERIMDMTDGLLVDDRKMVWKNILEGDLKGAADEYGRAMVEMTQFVYGKIDSPLWMRNPVARLFLAFTSFPINMTSLLLHDIKFSGSPGVGWLSRFTSRGGGARKLAGYAAAATAMTAITYPLGVDIGNKLWFLPSQLGAGIYGLTGGMFDMFMGGIVKRDPRQFNQGYWAAKQNATLLAPSGRSIKKLINIVQLARDNGWVYNSTRTKQIYRMSPVEAIFQLFDLSSRDLKIARRKARGLKDPTTWDWILDSIGDRVKTAIGG